MKKKTLKRSKHDRSKFRLAKSKELSNKLWNPKKTENVFFYSTKFESGNVSDYNL